MIPRTPEPERGFVLAVLAQGVDADEELAEVKELARTAGVEPVGSVVQHRAQPGAPHVRRQGQDRGAEGAVQARRRRERDRRRTSSTRRSSATSRTTLDARVVDRTQLILDIFAQHAHGRGQAPGRARAARVQPPAHARHVEAPRAPAAAALGDDAARASRSSRPTAGWRATGSRMLRQRLKDLRSSARRSARSAAAPRRRPSRSRATRTSASRRC